MKHWLRYHYTGSLITALAWVVLILCPRSVYGIAIDSSFKRALITPAACEISIIKKSTGTSGSDQYKQDNNSCGFNFSYRELAQKINIKFPIVKASGSQIPLQLELINPHLDEAIIHFYEGNHTVQTDTIGDFLFYESRQNYLLNFVVDIPKF